MEKSWPQQWQTKANKSICYLNGLNEIPPQVSELLAIYPWEGPVVEWWRSRLPDPIAKCYADNVLNWGINILQENALGYSLPVEDIATVVSIFGFRAHQVRLHLNPSIRPLFYHTPSFVRRLGHLFWLCLQTIMYRTSSVDNWPR